MIHIQSVKEHVEDVRRLQAELTRKIIQVKNDLEKDQALIIRSLETIERSMERVDRIAVRLPNPPEDDDK